MAKNNKYTSINFNHIYDKSTNNNSTTSSSKPAPKSANPSSFSASYSAVSAPNKPHGRILVLTRPTSKPVNPPSPKTNHLQQQQHPAPIQPVPDQPRSEPGSDAISLRPLGRTGTGPSLSGPIAAKGELPPPPLISPKTNKFVPPHLRPGFVPKEEAPPPGPDSGHRRAGHVGSWPGGYEEDGRPKSGGYERMRRGVGSDMSLMGRPRSSESRPSSNG